MRNSFTFPEEMQFPNLLSNGRKEFSGENTSTAFGMDLPTVVNWSGRTSKVADLRRRCKPRLEHRNTVVEGAYENANLAQGTFVHSSIQHISPFSPTDTSEVNTTEDVQMAIDHNLDGIVISNHGGRQLDGIAATLDTLRVCAPIAKVKIQIAVDGGVRKGSDIFKAIALGADHVFVGRVPIWGLAVRSSSQRSHFEGFPFADFSQVQWPKGRRARYKDAEGRIRHYHEACRVRWFEVLFFDWSRT